MKRTISIIALLLTALLLFAGCAKSADNMADTPMAAPAEEYKTEAAYDDYEVYEDYVIEEDAAADTTATGGFDLLDQGKTEPVQDRKIIYTADYTISTEHYEEDYQKILSAVDGVNGYLSGEETYGTEPQEYGDAGRRSYLTLRIPTEHYKSFLNTLAGIGTVENKIQTTDDITTEYYDNEARIEFYEAHYEKLMQYLEKATEMEDILSIESQITETLYTLDSLKGTRSYYDKMTQYTTVNISLNETVPSKTVATSKSPLGERISEGFHDTIKGMGVFFEGFVIVLISASPWLILLGGIFCAIFFPIRHHEKKKRAAYEAKKAAERKESETKE